MSGLLQLDKRYTFLWDKASNRPACVLLQALYGGNREVCFVFPDWEVAPTKTMVKVTGTGRQIEDQAAWKLNREQAGAQKGAEK